MFIIFAAHILRVLANGTIEDICAKLLSGAEQLPLPWRRFPGPVFVAWRSQWYQRLPLATSPAEKVTDWLVIPKAFHQGCKPGLVRAMLKFSWM